MILPALLLTLDEYSSWIAGRVIPMIRSAVRTTLRSLLRSDLVAELNQTVIDMQRTPQHGIVTNTQNLCSAFNPSKCACAHTHTHTQH